ncbi:MAG: YigZ family protein [Fusobacteriaceae bacterium]|nr:YigZ family protein [Fusobacteriaceae bacterium]
MKTVKKQCQIEFEEKKSKFIGYIKPIQNKEEAEKFIKEIKHKHPDATHNCSAYKVIFEGQEYFKSDDDGEPSGTAGKPIGEIINLMDVCNLVIVVTRYFGGIKLGAGGLVRNYAKTAKLAIMESDTEEYVKTKEFLLDFDYDKVQEVDQILKLDNIEVVEKNYGERVTYRVNIPDEIEKKLETLFGVLLIEI